MQARVWVMQIATGVIVGVVIALSALVLDLVKDRRTKLLDDRREAYTSFVSALSQWASIVTEAEVAGSAGDATRADGLRSTARAHELNVLLPAQARLRLVAPEETVKLARAATDALRDATGIRMPNLWPPYSKAWTSMNAQLRKDLAV